jgi:hypothetical protein
LSKTNSRALSGEDGFEVFCGIDVARDTHHAVALNGAGDRPVDRVLPNAEPDLTTLFEAFGFRAASIPVREDAGMGKHFDAATKERAVRMVRDPAPEYGSVTEACEVVGAKLGIGKATLRGWARQARVDVNRPGVSGDFDPWEGWRHAGRYEAAVRA